MNDILSIQSNINGILSGLGFLRTLGKSGNYDIWTSPVDSNVWLAIPRSFNVDQMGEFIGIVAETIAYTLGLDANGTLREELINQLQGLNYKIYNRVKLNKDYGSDSVPFEIVQVMTMRSISSFRTFTHLKSKVLQDIPMEDFQFNHTQRGSFVIPISIKYTLQTEPFPTMPNELNTLLHDYLNKLETISLSSVDSKDDFIENMFENGVDSKIVKDFIGSKSSLATIRNKYENIIEELTVSSSLNPILDQSLNKNENTFPTVNFSNIRPVPDQFIEELEQVEIKSNNLQIEEYGVPIVVEVDGIDKTGSAKFTVLGYAGITPDKPFKAHTGEQTRERLNMFAKAFPESTRITLKGDIRKKRGETGRIIIGEVMQIEEESIQRSML